MGVDVAARKTYKRARTIYVIGNVAFIADVTTRSSWWKTDASVAFIACPTCKARAGDLCKTSFGFHRGQTHHARRKNIISPNPMKVMPKNP